MKAGAGGVNLTKSNVRVGMCMAGFTEVNTLFKSV